VIEQQKGAAKVRRAVGQVGLRTPLGEVKRGGHPGQASADDQNGGA
jgi:hypothetical protein